QKLKTREAESQFIHGSWTDHSPVTCGEIPRGPVDFAERGKAGEHLWAGIERISFQGVIAPPECAEEYGVVLIELMVDASHVVWSAEQRGRVPQIGRRIETVAGRIAVRLRIGSEQLS